MKYFRGFPGWAEQVREVRVWTDQVLGAHSGFEIPDDTVASAVLLVSEAATNSIRYTASGRGGTFGVTLFVDLGRITVEVEDEGRPAGGTLPFLRPTTPMTQFGRGMALVDHFADSWGPLAEPRTGVTFTLTWETDRGTAAA
ncbi:ATP-binding protein [Nocardiopsis sediminis]|uniref:ATP-binding protein n=1 Tax=Nocardiopsis sediminis TaxID=1778267 RepID=A0ABV8FTD7_9ACTN